MMQAVTKILMIIFLIHTFAVSETLKQGVGIEGSVDKGENKYYQFYGFKGDTITITLDRLKDDADLYVNLGSKPKGNTNDTCHSWKSSTSDEECVITLTQNEFVYINVSGYKGTSYRVSTTVKSSVDVLEVDKTISGGVHYIKQYKYYKIDVQKGDELSVSLTQQDADGDLYVKFGSKPSRKNDNHNCVSKKGSNNDEQCVLDIPNDGTVYIGVQSWECIRNVQYKIKATLRHNNNNVSPQITTKVDEYSPNKTVSVNIDGQLSGDKDWAAIYRVGDNNDWGNVIAWNWVANGTSELNIIKHKMPVGEYEVRLFFHNSYKTEATYAFTVLEEINTYGEAGSHNVSTHTEISDGNSIVYYPSDIAQMPKTPLVFFLPGFGSQNHVSYKSLLTFIASHGYSVIYAKDHYGDPEKFIERFEKMLDGNNDVLPYVDTTRIGVIGHSSGGGDAFKILDHFSKKGYGVNGRFLMSLDGWFAFGMNSEQMRNLPSNTNVVIQRYEHPAHPNTQDPRITLSEYALLDSIANNKKDYQVYNPATHGYPGGAKDYSEMQGLLKPLDALMAVTFEGEEAAYDTALENGSDTPYEDGLENVREISEYPDRCNSHKNRAEVMDIDYCHEYNQPKVYPENTTFDNKIQADVAKPNYLDSYIDPVFGNKVTRITDRANQTGNNKPYPKTQVWNADQTLIRLGYRIYRADNFSETPMTTNMLLRGSLTEMKWSSYEPDIFYGIDIRWDRFVFVKAKINADDTITYTDMPNATFMKSEYDELKLGKYEGNLDFQDNYVVFSGRKKDSNRVTLIVYHLKDNYGKTYNSIVSNVTTDMRWYLEDANGNFTTSGIGSNQMFDWASISALGNYVIVNYRSKKGDLEQEYSIEQYSRDITHIRRLAEHGNHGDLGVDANGKEVYVQFGFGNQTGIWMYPLDGSPRTQLLPYKYNGGHVSCRNYKRPGWCYLNTRYVWKGAGMREVFALKLDNTKTVERFAQTHNTVANAPYTQVNVSPDGTQVLFNSDWGDSNALIDTYHVKVGE